jgi:hypothetical protein
MFIARNCLKFHCTFQLGALRAKDGSVSQEFQMVDACITCTVTFTYKGRHNSINYFEWPYLKLN